MSRPVHYACRDLGRVEFAVGGVYRVVVYSFEGSTGPYSFDWLATGPSAVISISKGVPISGEIANPGERDIYIFEVAAGEFGYFRSTSPLPCTSDNFWRIEDSEGRTPTWLTQAFGRSCTDLGRVAFPVAGSFRLVVFSSNGSTGPYSFEWLQSNPDEVLPLVKDALTTGDVTTAGERHTYLFTVSAGEVGYFRPGSLCPSGLPLQNIHVMQIEDLTGQPLPSGIRTTCQSIGPIVFADAGRYRLIVYSRQGSTGPYSVRWTTT